MAEEVKEVKKKYVTTSEAIEKGWLQRKKVYLKAVVDSGLGGAYNNDPSHIAFWAMEGAVKQFVLQIGRAHV